MLWWLRTLPLSPTKCAYVGCLQARFLGSHTVIAFCIAGRKLLAWPRSHTGGALRARNF